MPDEVRVIYIVPSDRNPWLEAQQCATGCLEDLQWFFSDEMDRLGYGPKTFEIGRDASGLVVFYQIDSELTMDQFSVTYWNNCKNAAANHALRDLDWVTVYFWFFTRKRTFKLKGVDIPAFLNLTKENRKGLRHVHGDIVSRVWNSWVSACSYGIFWG
jgi:hypothetical protein